MGDRHETRQDPRLVLFVFLSEGTTTGARLVSCSASKSY